MMGVGALIKNLWVRLLVVLNVISSIAIFLMALLVTADVVGRFVFNNPIAGTTELVRSALVAIVFLALAYTLRQGRHVRTTVILQRLSPVGVETVNIVASLIGAVMFAVMCRYSWDAAWSGWLIREYEGVQLHVPLYPVRFIVILGSGLVCLQFLINLLRSVDTLRGRRKGVT